MLIAVLTMDENPLAKKYLIDRGLEEADLANPLTTSQPREADGSGQVALDTIMAKGA